MTRLRRSAGRLTLAWLLCQGATLAATATILAIGSESLLECTCAHGDHAMCPMHHHQAPGSKRCFMRSADADGAAVLTSLFGVVAIAAASPSIASEELAVSPRFTALAPRSLRPVPPDPPPPRL